MIAGVALVTAIASCVDHSLQSRRSGRHLDQKSGVVTHVADGDTIDVDFPDPAPPVRIRLLGVDAPETGGPAAAYGQQASDYTRSRTLNKTVTLRLDSLQRERDKYGRLLAYVYLPNHELLNQLLVRDGHAFAYRPLPCDFTQQFESAENEARRSRRGMWKTITREQMPEWRREWMDERGLK